MCGVFSIRHCERVALPFPFTVTAHLRRSLTPPCCHPQATDSEALPPKQKHITALVKFSFFQESCPTIVRCVAFIVRATCQHCIATSEVDTRDSVHLPLALVASQAHTLVERTSKKTWIPVLKSLLTTHRLMRDASKVSHCRRCHPPSSDSLLMFAAHGIVNCNHSTVRTKHRVRIVVLFPATRLPHTAPNPTTMHSRWCVMCRLLQDFARMLSGIQGPFHLGYFSDTSSVEAQHLSIFIQR